MSLKRALSALALVLAGATSAHADDRAACVQSADRGQVARDQGKLSAARVEFTDCARAACPKLVAQQCTEWLAALTQEQPTVSFRALDPKGSEMLDVTVYIDSVERKGSLDGVPIDLDPGVHTFRFVHAGMPDVIVQSIIRLKEKNRVLEAKFGAAPAEQKEEHHHPFRFPWTASVSFVIGAASFIGMGVLVGTAAHDANAMRQSCAGSCLQADVDWVSTRVLLANIAMGVGIGGMSLFVLSLVIANTVGNKDDAPKASLLIGPGSLGISGRF
ncbi:MAG TPA: hypothetical protein VGH87_07965 [Polyangiaceae bacterium]|jgi:hypothetical protein